MSALISLHHVQQRTDGECLVACADMVLRYIGRPTYYRRLVSLLRVRQGIGVRSSNIRLLERLGVKIRYMEGSLPTLHTQLQNGNPCIVFVLTGELPYWNYSVQHALVVVGIDDQFVWVHDPEFEQAPIPVPVGDFDLAWFEMEEMFAVIIR